MKKYFMLLKAAIIMFAAFTLYSCEKESETVFQPVIEQSTDSVLTINGKRMEWNFYIRKNQNKKLSKGYDFDLSDFIETDTAYYVNDKSIKYLVMKVNRKASKGFFYIMLENLSIKSNDGCWVFADDEKNVPVYGRLYNWETADKLSSKIKMRVPMYKSDSITEVYPGKKFSVSGRLPELRDVLDILEITGEFPNYVDERAYDLTYNREISDDFFYDAFIAGIEDGNGDDESTYHTLGGWRNTAYSEKPSDYYINGIYADLNNRGTFWTAGKTNKTGNSPFIIQRRYVWFDTEEIYDYRAYFGSYSKSYGFSVRYVFDPIYKRVK